MIGGRREGEKGRRRGEWGRKRRRKQEKRKGESGIRVGKERGRITEWSRHSTTQEGSRGVSSAVVRTERIQFRPSLVAANKSNPKTKVAHPSCIQVSHMTMEAKTTLTVLRLITIKKRHGSFNILPNLSSKK